MGFFSKPDHPLVTHIHKLIDQFGIDQYGNIKGTGYKFFNVDTHWNNSYDYTGSLEDSGMLVFYINNEEYSGIIKLFTRAERLINEARQRMKDEETQARINSDIEKYLASHSPLPEAMEDLKQIEYHKKEIIKLSQKWQDKITSLHL